MRGRRRCWLHGGLSTGPTSREGLARIRAANTRHGRYSREHLALNRLVREYRMNGIRSARAMRDLWARAKAMWACAEAMPPSVLERMREQVRADLARDEQHRLSARR